MTYRFDIFASLKRTALRDAFAAPYADDDQVLSAPPSFQVLDAKR